jgi:nicotinate-nucleotide adenylyltransferase
MGADSVNDILTWHRGAELFDWCRIVAATRPGYDLDRARDLLSPAQRERVLWLEVPGLHIASRDLRRRVAHGWPIRYLVPDVVEEAIKEWQLYRER